MRHPFRIQSLALLILLAAPLSASTPAPALSFGRFGPLAIYRPASTPSEVVLFVSGDGGWNLGVVGMARALTDEGALVVGLDFRHYLKEIAAAKDECTSAAVDFEALSQYLQKKLDLPRYMPPVLVGYSSGATLVYATLVQAPPGTFRGAVSLGFCPDLAISKPFCKGHGLTFERGAKGKGYNFLTTNSLENRWVALQGTIDQVCSPPDTEAFVKKVHNGEIVMLPKVGHGFSVEPRWMPQFKEAYRRVVHETHAAAQPLREEVRDLPLVEVPASGPASASTRESNTGRLAVILSGDGGWAGIDREVGGELAAHGIPVVGLNSLSYFWTPRTPDGAARDLGRIVRHYMAGWHRQQVILIGYSRGADVLPFLASRLPPDLLSHVELIALLGPGQEAAFQFHLSDWLGGETPGLPLLPEVRKLAGKPLLCLYGEKESDSLCPQLGPKLGRVVAFGGAHHFGGDYGAIAERILKELSGGSPSGTAVVGSPAGGSTGTRTGRARSRVT